jgi:two-component system sensor histidine kinase KdpD
MPANRGRAAGLPASPWLTWFAWLAVLVAATAVMLLVRDRLGPAHVTLAYMLVVLGASAQGGRPLGLTVSVAAFVAFDVLFVPPYSSLVVSNPLDWLILAAFLVTSVVAAQLLYRARAVAGAAREAAALREADRMKDALLASVSHDLRTPLTTIKALAHDIRVEGDERAAVIEGETDRLTRLVADLLDLSRLQGGALRLDIQLTAADELLESVAQAVTGLPGAERLRMSLDSTEPLLIGRFDIVHSARALANLVANALAYSAEESPVDVTAARDADWLVFAVADRGRGIPDPERERIFDAFHRGPAVIGNTRGSGLGLSIARQLAEAQHGSIAVEPREGGGSVFTLRLPAADLEESAKSL